MPRLKGSADLLEDRRKRALALLDSGYSLNEVGRRIGCNASSVMRWRNARRKRGAEGLRVRFSPGRPWKLDRKGQRINNLYNLRKRYTLLPWEKSWQPYARSIGCSVAC